MNRRGGLHLERHDREDQQQVGEDRGALAGPRRQCDQELMEFNPEKAA
jgi:hypothetical protein